MASKNYKYGDFIREYYINPVIYRDSQEVGYNDESFKGENSLNDDGSLTGQVIEKMYPLYEELVKKYGWDDYDSIYTLYLEELIAVREEVFGDKFFNDEVFFSMFEANVASYGDSLTGTEDVFDENTGIQLSYKSTGIYEKIYGEDYVFFYNVLGETPVDIDVYKTTADTVAFDKYCIELADITEVKNLNVIVSLIEGESTSIEPLSQVDVIIVKIGSSWYIDNTSTDTSVLYGFYL